MLTKNVEVSDDDEVSASGVDTALATEELELGALGGLESTLLEATLPP